MSSKMEKVLQKAAGLAEPSSSEVKRVQRVADDVLRMVRDEAGKHPLRPQVVLGGSFAKGTWLKGEADIDVFMKFPEDSAEDVLEKVGVSLALKALDKHEPTLRYAEHPYVEAFVDEIRVNVVPCFDVSKGRWRSAADRSPYHTALITRTFYDSMRRDARLLKKFLKALGVYGAEIKVQGFSGYVSEVLVWKYGSFTSVLTAASDFDEREVICIGEADEDVREVFHSPLIILDPVDKRRNLGTAISSENVAALILASRRFLASPAISFFKASARFDAFVRLSRSRLLDGLVLVVFTHGLRSQDILWGQLKRSLHRIQGQLEGLGFRVLRSGCGSDDVGESAFIFLLESRVLSKYVMRLGPPVYMGDDVDKFLEKNIRKSVMLWIRSDGRVVGLQDRRVSEVKTALESLLSQEAHGLGLAPGLKSDVVNSHRVHLGRDVLKPAARHRWLAEAMLRIVSTDKTSLSAS